MTELTHPRFRHARLALAASMLLMGACGIIYEYTLGVLGDNLMGSSHEQIFVIIGLMMFAMGIGAALQRHLIGNLIDKFLAFELLLGVVGGTSALAIYATFTWTASYHLVHYGFALTIGILIGLEIPLLIRINNEYSSNLRSNLSEILAMDYIGALLGALVFAYVLLSRLSVPRISAVLGLVNTALALGGVAYFWPLVRRRKALLGASVAGLVLLATCFGLSDRAVATLEQRCFRDPIVYRETSKYQHIVLTERDDRLDLYLNGKIQFSSRDEAIYHELLVHVPMAAASRRDRVLILGGGDGLALREVLKYPDVKTVTLVDIDPAIVRLASGHPGLVRLNGGAFRDARVHVLTSGAISPGKPVVVTRRTKLSEFLLDDREYPLADVRVFNIDADLFVREIDEQFDVAILDFPDPESVELAKLYSREFYRALSARLFPGGVLSVQSTSPYYAKKAFLCVGVTLRSAGFEAIPYHEQIPSFEEWGWYVAWKDDGGSRDRLSGLKGLVEIPVPTRYATPDVLRSAFVFGKGWLAGASEIAANTKMRPSMVDYYRQAWR